MNGDSQLSPLDALLVINRLNATRGGSGEGEAEGEASGQFMQLLSSGGLASSTSSTEESELNSPLVEDLTPAITSAIGARNTGTVYGPFLSDSNASATDSVFGEGESGLDDLLSQLAPDVEETRKKK